MEDPEIDALAAIQRRLNELEPSAQQRVAAWVKHRYGTRPRGGAKGSPQMNAVFRVLKREGGTGRVRDLTQKIVEEEGGPTSKKSAEVLLVRMADRSLLTRVSRGVYALPEEATNGKP